MSIKIEKNLTFKPLCHFDAENIFFGYSSLEECVTWMNWDIHKNISDTISYIENSIINKYKIYTVYEDDEFIGSLDIRFLDGMTLEIGYVVAKSKWNKGYATKMVKYFLQDILSRYDIYRVIAHCAVKNIQSKKVLEKNGFEVKYLKKDYYTLNNQGHILTDAYLLELKNDYIKL